MPQWKLTAFYPANMVSAISMSFEHCLCGSLLEWNLAKHKRCKCCMFFPRHPTHSRVKEFVETGPCKQSSYVYILVSERRKVCETSICGNLILVLCTAGVNSLYICMMTKTKTNKLCYINIREGPAKWQVLPCNKLLVYGSRHCYSVGISLM